MNDITITKDNINISGDLLCEEGYINAEYECWFDTEQYFNRTLDNNSWFNVYTNWYPDGRIDGIATVDSEDSEEELSWELTEEEQELFRSLMEEYCKSKYGKSLSELYAESTESDVTEALKTLKELIDERDALLEEIETKRKQNESALLSIREFYTKATEYMKMCHRHRIRMNVKYNIENRDIEILCNDRQFLIRKYSPQSVLRNSSNSYMYFVNGSFEDSILGKSPSLNTITEKGGNITKDAKFFFEHIETFTELIDSGLSECVENQIKEAKKALGITSD